MEYSEVYLPRNYFLNLGSFSDDDFRLFTKTMEIEPDVKGYYPVFLIISRLNMMRKKGRWGTGDADTALKLARIDQVRLNTAIKSKEYIPISVAKNRIKGILLAVANKIRYAIKIASPQLVMISDIRAVESILIDKYNTAINMLEDEASALKRWEDHGIDLMSGTRTDMVEDSDENPSH